MEPMNIISTIRIWENKITEKCPIITLMAIMVIGFFAMIFYRLEEIRAEISSTEWQMSSIQDNLSSIESNLASIESDVSSIQSEVSSIKRRQEY